MKVFWYVYGLGLIIYIYLILFQENYHLLPHLSTYSLFGIFAYSFEKKEDKKKEKKLKIETFEN